jgi:CBS domain-containing protein
VGSIAGSQARSLVVTNDHQIVLGRVHPRQIDAADATPVEEVMEPAPTTVRAHEPLAPLLERMARRGVAEVIVTTPQGELLGVLHQLAETQ